MLKNKYEPYDISEIETLLTEPWEISDKPYMLHAAFAISTIYDVFISNEDEEEVSPENIWGCEVNKKLLDRLVIDIAEDFNDAAKNRKPIKIWGRGYSIRKVNAYDHNRLHLIFDFPMKDKENYFLKKEGVLNLSGVIPIQLKPYSVKKEQAKKNREYLRQVVMLAEASPDGWDKLTDMEVMMYCWALYYNRYQSDNFLQFKKQYQDYLYVRESDLTKCLNEQSSLLGKPKGLYAFSFDKIQNWHKENRLISYAIQIPVQEAENYWYEIALNTTFKPIDFK